MIHPILLWALKEWTYLFFFFFPLFKHLKEIFFAFEFHLSLDSSCYAKAYCELSPKLFRASLD